MKFKIDHDLHMHSRFSLCSGSDSHTGERMLQYAKDFGFHTLVVTDHFWDEKAGEAPIDYRGLNFAHISQIKPLPKAEGIRFLFGCETELDYNFKLGLSKERYDEFDFIVIPTTHMHLKSAIKDEDFNNTEKRIELWTQRFEAVLNMDLPFHKVGIAHLACTGVARDRAEYIKVLDSIPEENMRRLFTKAKELGAGIEINGSDVEFADSEADTVLRMFRIAKECGCKFYLGSDLHSTKRPYESFIPLYERAIDLLGLTEEDKFVI